MIQIEEMRRDDLVNLLLEKAKVLKKYNESAKKSSEARGNNDIYSSRARVTSLNAKMMRDAEAYESVLSDIKRITSNLY